MKSPKCGEFLIVGIVLNNSYTGTQRGIIGIKPEKSDGSLVECLKCPKCGYSVVDEKYTQPDYGR
jgi:hypothetical protein